MPNATNDESQNLDLSVLKQLTKQMSISIFIRLSNVTVLKKIYISCGFVKIR